MLGLKVLDYCLQVAAILLGCVVVAPPASADPPVRGELTIRGHSIVTLLLVGKDGGAGIRFENVGETVHLPVGTYRVEAVCLKGDYLFEPTAADRKAWFEVTEEGPNELTVGAPLYPTLTARRHGGFVEMDYGVVDGAGRSYSMESHRGPEPTFTVSVDGQQVGSGTFEYG